MKIEKLNDNQIRCTLNKRDLIDRELKISELAYGSEKAKGLFRDMMNQALMNLASSRMIYLWSLRRSRFPETVSCSL